MKTTITLESLVARLQKVATRRSFIRLADLALEEAAGAILYAQHCDLADALLSIRDAAEYGAFAKRCIAKAQRG